MNDEVARAIAEYPPRGPERKPVRRALVGAWAGLVATFLAIIFGGGAGASVAALAQGSTLDLGAIRPDPPPRVAWQVAGVVVFAVVGAAMAGGVGLTLELPKGSRRALLVAATAIATGLGAALSPLIPPERAPLAVLAGTLGVAALAGAALLRPER